MRHIATTSTDFPLRDALADSKRFSLAGGIDYVACDGNLSVNADALGYFALSVIWRAAASNWKLDGADIESLELGPYFDKLRAYLVGECDLPETVAVQVIACSSAEVLLMSTMPQSRNVGEYYSHCFDVPGISFLVDMGSRLPQEVRQMCIFRGPGRPIFYTEWAQKVNATDYVRQKRLRDSRQR